MQDSRLAKLADVLVNYSTAVKPNDLVRISGSPITEPLAVEVCRAVLRAGGHPRVILTPEVCGELKLAEGNQQQLEYEDPIALYEVEKIDVSIGFFGSENTRAMSGIDPARQAVVSRARKRYFDTFLRRAGEKSLRWTGTQYPCQASAQDAEMSLRQYEDFVFRAGLLHLDDPVAAWRQVSQCQQRLVDYLNGKHEVRFVTPLGTDLRLGVEGRTWLNCDGHENFPDGEVFTGPVEDATEGTVVFPFPAVYHGREADGIRLVFKAGRVVEATAAKGEDFLHAMLDQDAGARVLGELALGTNYSITRHTKNILFDEKIGGTFHVAVGAAYPETGGKNNSALHWDMICDLHQGGEVYVDGKLISRDGRFLDESWPRP